MQSPADARGPKAWGWALGSVLGVAALVRLLLLRLPRLWYDEATSGLLGLSVLKGELPIYFFGQSEGQDDRLRHDQPGTGTLTT